MDGKRLFVIKILINLPLILIKLKKVEDFPEDKATRKHIDLSYNLSLLTNGIEALRHIEDCQSPISSPLIENKEYSTLSIRWKDEIKVDENYSRPICRKQRFCKLATIIQVTLSKSKRVKLPLRSKNSYLFVVFSLFYYKKATTTLNKDH